MGLELCLLTSHSDQPLSPQESCNCHVLAYGFGRISSFQRLKMPLISNRVKFCDIWPSCTGHVKCISEFGPQLTEVLLLCLSPKKHNLQSSWNNCIFIFLVANHGGNHYPSLSGRGYPWNRLKHRPKPLSKSVSDQPRRYHSLKTRENHEVFLNFTWEVVESHIIYIYMYTSNFPWKLEIATKPLFGRQVLNHLVQHQWSLSFDSGG